MHLAGGMCCPIAAATLPREAHALAAADLTSLARRVRQPVLLLVGTASPPWASEITRNSPPPPYGYRDRTPRRRP
jgi:hypothetical protein